MKLSDSSGSVGTYVGLRVLDASRDEIIKHCLRQRIAVNLPPTEKSLHTTVIYSRTRCANIVSNDTVIYPALFTRFACFDSSNGEKCLVILLDSPAIVARHLKLMSDHSATYDYEEYVPHITLNYNYNGREIDTLPPITFPIFLGNEYVEDLDLKWGQNEV